MNILFTDTGWNQYIEWQGQDKKIVKRINQLLKSIDRDGAIQGIGKPELLKHNKSGLYSRRIDEANRLVYEMSDNQIIVKSCKGHYEDKKMEVVKGQLLFLCIMAAGQGGLSRACPVSRGGREQYSGILLY